MSKLGSLYIQLGEPEGELAGCCETAEWAAGYIESLRQQLDAAQADAKHAWEKAGEACTAHAASIKRELILLEFVQKIKKQTPEKPDYWSSCSQCEHNSNEGEDILEALAATSDLSGVILCHTKPVGEVGTIDTDDDGEPSAWVNLYNDVDLGEILYRAWEPTK